MKDVAHHLKHVQRKVIQSVRRENEKKETREVEKQPLPTKSAKK